MDGSLVCDIVFRTLSGISIDSHREPRGAEPTNRVGGARSF